MRKLSPKYLRNKRHKKRFLWIVVLLAAGLTATLLILNAMRDTIVFFYTPEDIKTKSIESNLYSGNIYFRIGGLVKEGSVKQWGTKITFILTDTKYDIPVLYTGIVPALFREGQGVVAEGRLGKDGTMHAETILAKHDEKYMPKEVVEALKRQGKWEGEQK